MVSTRSPTITVDSATGNQEAAVRLRQRECAGRSRTRARPPPRRAASEAEKPISGSISRRTAASRMAQVRKVGRTNGLHQKRPGRQADDVQRPGRDAGRSAARPAARPGCAVARIVELSRVVPRTQKLVSTTHSSSSSCRPDIGSPQQEDDAEHRERRRPRPGTGAPGSCAAAPCWTRRRRPRRRPATRPASRSDRRQPAAADCPRGHQHADHQRAEQRQLDARSRSRIMASSGPLWSSTMTSWIMVSSRWVAGSSTGTRRGLRQRQHEQARPP